MGPGTTPAWAERLRRRRGQPTAGESANLSVGKLSINNGKLMVGKANSSAQPKVYDKVDITVTNFSATSQFPSS